MDSLGESNNAANKWKSPRVYATNSPNPCIPRLESRILANSLNCTLNQVLEQVLSLQVLGRKMIRE